MDTTVSMMVMFHQLLVMAYDRYLALPEDMKTRNIFSNYISVLMGNEEANIPDVLSQVCG